MNERDTAESIPESIPVLRNRFGYCRIDYGMTESVHGRKIRVPRRIIKAPKIFFGALRKRNDNLVKVSKHRKVIIEGSSGIVKINMDPMLREP